MRRALSASCFFVIALAVTHDAHAQVRRVPTPRFTTMSNSEDDEDDTPQQEIIEESTVSPLRARFGADHAEELLRTTESADIRRGIVRAASAGTPEAISMLVTQADGPSNDDLTLIELARALAPFANQEAPRQRLVQMLNATARSSRSRTTTTAISAARVDLARQIAARALVASRDPKALDAVGNAAREGGTSQQNALRALASDPVSSPTEGTYVPPSSAAVARALAQSGDLRALDALLAKAQGGAEASTRAACILALGQLGDGRVRPIAIAAFADQDAHVRAAAGEALVLVDALERFHAVTQLISGDETLRAGIRLAHRAQDGEVVKALAARFAAMNDPEVRLEILAALGRGIATDDGLKVLASVAADPKLGGDAIYAIARSPNPHAMATLERLARERPLRRLAVRGYVARAVLRGERSSDIETLVNELRTSNESPSRAIAAFARVALGHDDASDWLDDRDAAVRRAAAMGALASWNGHALPAANALLRRYVREPDEPTRAVLAIGLLGGDPSALVPTRSLVERIEAGGADAPLSAVALARAQGRHHQGEARAVRVLTGSDHARACRTRAWRERRTKRDGSARGSHAIRSGASRSPRADHRARDALARAVAQRDALGDGAVRSRGAHSRRRRARSLRRAAAVAVARARSRMAPRRNGERSRARSHDARVVRHRRRHRDPDRVRRRRLRARPRHPARRRPPRPRAHGPTAMTSAAPPSAQLNFEQSMERLSHIVEKLERGDLPLEESLKLFEEGVRLSRLAQDRLDNAQQRIERLLTVDSQGKARTAPFESTDDEEPPF